MRTTREGEDEGRGCEKERGAKGPKGHLSISGGVKWAGACAVLPRTAALSLTLDAARAASVQPNTTAVTAAPRRVAPRRAEPNQAFSSTLRTPSLLSRPR